jgi:hypothetical protein
MCGVDFHHLSPTHVAVWDCSRALCRLFDAHSAPADEDKGTHPAASQISDLGVDFSHCRVLELGAGQGLVGLFVAQRWSSSTVTLCDLACATAGLESNVSLNGPSSISVQVVSFGDVLSLPVDVILCSDLLYSHMSRPHCWDELAFTLGAALADGKPVVWFIFQERWATRDISPFLAELRRVFDEREEQIGRVEHRSRRNVDIIEVRFDDRPNEEASGDFPMRVLRIAAAA